MLIRLSLAAIAAVVAFSLMVPGAISEEDEGPDLSEAVLDDPEVIARGQELFAEQCTLCHGRTAYPGKAPILRPSRYDAEFVYNRVAFGFRDMPAWQDLYSDEDIVAMVAYVLSDRFSH